MKLDGVSVETAFGRFTLLDNDNYGYDIVHTLGSKSKVVEYEKVPGYLRKQAKELYKQGKREDANALFKLARDVES